MSSPLAETDLSSLDSFSHIYETHFLGIYQFVYFKVHHRETAEDLCSEIWMKILKNLPQFTPEKASLKTWIFRIARNHIIDFYRTRKPQNEDIDNNWSIHTKENISEHTQIKIDAQKALENFNHLKHEHREIVLLRVWHNLSYKEIADITGKSADNCKTITLRSLKKVKENMLLIALSFVLFL